MISCVLRIVVYISLLYKSLIFVVVVVGGGGGGDVVMLNGVCVGVLII